MDSRAIPSHSTDVFRLGYQPALDGLRAVAVLAVMLRHTRWAGLRLEGGFLGVDVFFALSGFLITSLLLEEHQATGRVCFRAFYVRRALRLLPALAPIVVIGGAALLATDPGWPTIGFVASVVFYTANWAMIYGLPMGFLGHTWSLAIEEQFYILWPVLLLLLLRGIRRRGPLLLLIVATAALAAVHRLMIIGPYAGTRRVYLGLDTHADPLLIGCAVGILCHSSYFRRSRAAVAVWNALGVIGGFVLVALFASAPSPSDYTPSSAITWAALASACVIVAAILPTSLCACVLRCPPLPWIGRRSYALYLWHFPVFFVAGPLWNPGFGLGTILLAWAASVALAAASFHYLEAPALRFKATLSDATPVPPFASWAVMRGVRGTAGGAEGLVSGLRTGMTRMRVIPARNSRPGEESQEATDQRL